MVCHDFNILLKVKINNDNNVSVFWNKKYLTLNDSIHLLLGKETKTYFLQTWRCQNISISYNKMWNVHCRFISGVLNSKNLKTDAKYDLFHHIKSIKKHNLWSSYNILFYTSPKRSMQVYYNNQTKRAFMKSNYCLFFLVKRPSNQLCYYTHKLVQNLPSCEKKNRHFNYF